ncbi:Mth938-like domain-containing protein [Ideonella sp.]|uniref:Mth938-like domain-containing protein n=1 Tax=Ideonella sp. TaxID=1929293 RepID=UPI002B4761A7|nr:MTH938/NDUFAF3 family protein [Ideonella sp.]HJV68063.1 MTH938/NDUFAF3 family protein [Ideonella sp.]
MKFQPDHLDGVNAISKLETGRVWVHATSFASSVLVPWRGEVKAWPVASASALQADHFAAIVEFDPELVVFGSGATHRFVSPALYRSLIERRIGVETMDTAAACRTFNVLVHEGRRVLGAFVIEGAVAHGP